MGDKLNILIAGFACDDFSLLNNHRKDLEEKGESGDTFHAILASLPVLRPDMVILENVKSAPWLHEKVKHKVSKNGHKQIGIDKHFEIAGYYSRFVMVDSKTYYIPHTRQRGYMLAIRKDSIPEQWKSKGDAFIKGKLDNFEKIFKSFQHRPTAPIEAHMFESDDPRLEVLRINPTDEQSSKNRKPPTWEACRIGHEEYRSGLGLGLRRPVTQWRADGSKTLPDYYHDMKTTERLTDSLDVAHLRNLRRGTDDRWYRFVIPFHLFF